MSTTPCMNFLNSYDSKASNTNQGLQMFLQNGVNTLYDFGQSSTNGYSLSSYTMNQLQTNNNNINNSQTEQDNYINRGEKRKCSPTLTNAKKEAKLRPSLPSNFYSLLAQIHNINNTEDSN